MGALEELRDEVNGKRRRFFNVSKEAADLFKKWLADYHKAPTLEKVLNQYEMPDLRDGRYVLASFRYEGKHMVAETTVLPRARRGKNSISLRPASPWDEHGESRGFNSEVMYLVAKFAAIGADCEKLRLCPWCGDCYVARGARKYCSALHGRRAAAARIVGAKYDEKRNKRIAACHAAYTKYQTLRPKPRMPEAEYVLREANRHLPRAYKIGGPRMQTNFITRNATAIGMPKTKGAK
jgi:hypothetical protein